MKKLNRLWVPAVALSLFAVACSDEQVVNPTESSVPTPLFGKGALVQSVTGSGQFTFQGTLRNFGFSALEHQDGTVTGAFAGHRNRIDGARSVQGFVECFTIVGDEAWIAGTVEQVSPGPTTTTEVAGFRVVDNGRASRRSATPDGISFLRRVSVFEGPTGQPLATSQDFCDEQPTRATLSTNVPFFGTVAVEAGDIQVRP